MFRVCSLHYRNPFAAFWQTVSSRRGRFIVPSYPYISTKWRTEMRLRWNEYTYLMMCKCVFGNGKIRARWIGPYAWRSVRGAFRGQTWIFCGVFVTCSLSACSIIVIQKYGFCRVKVWFLACKKGVFTLQKYGFCIAKVGILCMLLCYNELQVYVGAQFFGICIYVNTHKTALQFVIFCTSRQIKKERSKPMMFVSLLCFMC